MLFENLLLRKLLRTQQKLMDVPASKGVTLPVASCAGSATKPARFQGPSADALTERQREVRDEIVKTRPTTGLAGPFGPWLANPELAHAAQRLGRICRYETSLEPLESELVILTVATHHKSAREWAIHEPEALRAGLSAQVVAQVQTGRPLEAATAGARLATLHGFVVDVLRESRASDASYAAMNGVFSAPQIVEVVAVVGYYSFVAMTLNVFEL